MKLLFGRICWESNSEIQKLQQKIISLKNDNSSLRQKLLDLKQNSLILETKVKESKEQLLSIDNKIKNLKLINNSVSIELPSLGSIHEKKNKKQTLILGYYGASNFGDELMLAALLKNLRKKKGNATDFSIILTEDGGNYEYSKWGCPCFYPPTNINELTEAADFFDELIIGGGAHIDDLDFPVYSFIPYLALELSLLMLQKNKKVNWLAVSSNNILVNKEYIEKLSQIIKYSEEFSVRDPYSLETLRASGIDSQKVIIREDLGYLFDYDIKRLGIVINVLEDEEKLKMILSEVMQFCRESLIETKKWGITLIPFYNGNHLDQNLITYLMGLLKEESDSISISVIPEYTDIWSMLVTIKGCDALFSMKYHSSLLGLKMGIPTINYVTDKHRHYINKMKYLQDRFPNSKFLFSSQYDKGKLLDHLKNL